MIAMAAGAVVLAATLQSLDHFERRLSKQHVAAAQTQDLRIGLKVLEDELRMIGAGSAPSVTSMLVAGQQEVEFTANLAGLATTLTDAVSSDQQELPVLNGSDWPKGKRIRVCDRYRCAQGRLARDGRARVLSLSGPLGLGFAPGSDVRIVNNVRYYVKTDRTGAARMMREIDGGANPLIGEVARLQLYYFDRNGAPTADPSRVARIRIEASARGERVPVTRDVAIRGR
jgi:hypothetical protein